ncbi:MAG: adenylate/guanylate cyclase domain-containing protein [Acidimicrobiia bacterium]
MDQVKCQNCGHENPSDARFCTQCGQSLTITCPVCGTVSNASARFCSSCGAALGEHTPPSEPDQPSPVGQDLSRYLPPELLAKMRSAQEGQAMQGERRTVTMLFADIQGSTSSAEQLDPEDWAEIMNGAFEHLIAPIYRYEGTVAQLRGDAVLAFFGAPLAHEDDAVRAVRAGVEMVDAMTEYSGGIEERWGIPLHVRVGINTGLVVVGAMGSDLRMEYTALGDAINVAARMEQTAQPDTVRVTAQTLALTNGMFETEELGSVEVKGKSEPVPASRVIRYVGTHSPDVGLPIVGREWELQQLDDLRVRVVGGSGAIASAIGEAGIGKSRLINEFTHRALETLHVAHRFDVSGDVAWLSASSRSYDSERPYSTVSEMLSRWWLGVEGQPDFEKVTAAVAAAGITDPDAPALLSHVARVPLSGAEGDFIEALETNVLSARAGDTVLSYIRALTAARPTIVVLEDLHWSDDLSLALIESMMNLTETTPLGLIVAMRPYREEPTWRIHEVAERDHHHRYLHLELAALSEEESRGLVESLVDAENLTDETRDRILGRAEGNPLFLEQMARSVDELGSSGLETSAVPNTLTGLITARLDRLSEQTRYFIQMASVLGSEFRASTVSILVDRPSVDDDVTDLLKRGILFEVPGRPGTFGFKHALMQEVAYDTILKRTRRELHGRVADHFIETGGNARAIAHHLIASGDPQRAFPYLLEAGLHASRSMALADAIELLTTAIQNAPDDADPEMIERAHDGLGDAYSLIPDLSQAAAAYQRLYDFGEDRERPAAKVAALNRLAYATAVLGADLDKAATYLADARRIAEESHDDLGLAEYHMNACFIASMAGNPNEAVAHDEETVRIGEEAGSDRIRLLGLVRRATNYILLLDFEQGLPAINESLEEAREAGMEEAAAIIEFAGAGLVAALRGDLRSAAETADRAFVTLERYGSFYMAMNRLFVGDWKYQLGDLEDALSRFADTRRVGERVGQTFATAAAASGMALVYATAGMDEELPALRDEVEKSLGGPLGEFLASTALADLGFASLLSGQLDRASNDFAAALGVSSATRFVERPRLLAGQALTLVAAGDLQGAAGSLAEARSTVDEKELTGYEAVVGLAEGRLHIARGELDEAEAALTGAQEQAMSIGQRVTLVMILGARAELAGMAADPDRAARHLDQAREVVTSIVEGIADEQLRARFLQRWTVELTPGTGQDSK